MASGSQLSLPLHALPSFACLLEATAVSVSKTWNALRDREPVETNASRDMHACMEKMGYTIPVEVHTMNHHSDLPKPITSYHIKPESWIQHWANDCPELLAGWNGNRRENFSAFWHAYQVHHPSHKVFTEHEGRLRDVVPIILHGDEGRAVKRTNYLVLSMESPLGSLDDPTTRTCNCREEMGKRVGIPSYGQDLGTLDAETIGICRNQVTNFKGHSYLSHFLLFGLGGWVYKKHPHVVDELVAETVKSLEKLFYSGVNTSCGTIYAAIVGIKGDMDFHKKIMELERSYSNVGTKSALECCHLCLAGGPNVDFEDYAESPGWLQTLNLQRPWSTDNPPALSGVPYDDTCSEQMLQPDLFHIHRLGAARDLIGGILIFLMRLKFFDYPGSSINIDDRFKRAFSYFALWCASKGKSPGLRSFTKQFFNMKTLISAPWASCKASDSVLLLRWLSHTLKLNLENPIVPGHDNLLKRMLQVTEAALKLGMLHHHKLLLSRNCAKMFYVHTMTLLRGYAFLGNESLKIHIRAFIQKPKHHALHHIAVFIKKELEKGCSLILSPQCFACDMNEDFLGRISRLSRRVGFRLCDLRVIHRYFIKVKVLLRRRMARKAQNGCHVWSKFNRPKPKRT